MQQQLLFIVIEIDSEKESE